MKTLRAKSGPFVERPYFSDEEIERISYDELFSVKLYPSVPEPIKIDLFIEKKFGVTPVFEDLSRGILGYTMFGSSGVERIVVSRELSEQTDSVSQRRLSTTLAHESGHGLLHSHLFVLGTTDVSLFGESSDVEKTKILCRNEAIVSTSNVRNRYDGRWWDTKQIVSWAHFYYPSGLSVKV